MEVFHFSLSFVRFVFLSAIVSIHLIGSSLQANPEANFIQNLKSVYLTSEALEQTVVGIEIEFNGITEFKAAQIVRDVLGGYFEGQYVKGTRIGDLRIYRDGSMWEYDDWARLHNQGKESRLRRLWYSIKDALRAPVEVVFPPLKYSELHWVEKIAEQLAEAGAKGPSGLSTGAVHVNIQVDPKNHRALKNALANYTNNGTLFRRYYKPALLRRWSNFIPEPKEDLKAKLRSYEYQPTAQEFWVDFRRSAHVKFSRINIAPALLEDLSVSTEDKQALIDEEWGKRPAVELREANTVFEKGYITENAQVGIALLEASKQTGQLNPQDLQLQADLKGGKAVESSVEFTNAKFEHSLPNIIQPDHYTRIRIKKVDGAYTSFVDESLLRRWGIVTEGQSLLDIKKGVTERYAFEVIRPGESDEKALPGEEVLSMAYDDGYLARGDGRANWLFEVSIPGRGVFDLGSKGTGLTIFGIPQESIDKGFHIGEKDGYLSLEEAVHTLQSSWMLSAIGIESEQILSIIETGKQTGFNLSPPAPQPAASVIRAFDTGLRGAHLRKYDDETLRRVTYWLRERESVRLNRPGELPPTEVYLRNKIRRDARRAALAQHFWVIHGAINPANIFEGGWADLYYVEALQVPDGHYTSLNVYSRLENQMHEFFKVTNEFVNYIKRAHPTVQMDTKHEFWTEYRNELSRLELISAGFTQDQADTLLKRQPALAKEYGRLVWDINYNHLKTNTRELKRVIPELLLAYVDRFKDLNWGKLVSQVAQRQEDIKPERVFAEEMFDKDRILYLIKTWVSRLTGGEGDRLTNIPDAKARQIAETTLRLAQSLGSGQRQILTSMQSQAGRISDIVFPTANDFRENFSKYQASGSKDLNAFLSDLKAEMARLQGEIRWTYGPLDQASRPAIGKADLEKSILAFPLHQDRPLKGDGCAQLLAE